MGGFCASERPHNPDCEYYAGGGDVAPDWSSLSSEPPEQAPDWNSLSTQAPGSATPNWEELSTEPPQSDDGGYLEQAKAGLEGASQGLLGPLAPAIETGLGISTKEAIAKRQQDFPLTHGIAEGATFVGSLLAGTGEAGLIARAAAPIAEAANLGKAGTLVLKAAVESASLAGSDEMTKAFLGVPGSDPEHPVSAALLNVGAAGLVGGLTGGVFSLGEGMIGKGIDSLNGPKGIAATEKFLDALGDSKDPLGDLGVTNKISGAISKTIAWPLAMKTGTGQIGYEAVQEAVDHVVKKMVGKANPYASDAIIKAILTNEVSGVPNAVHYATQAARGAQKAVSGVSALFKVGSAQIAPEISEAARNTFKEFIENGQVDQQLQNSMQDDAQHPHFAQGGEVKAAPNQAFSKIFPEQNTLLNTAKGRISTYLNKIRPLENKPKAAFDDDAPNKEQKRQYEKAVDLAINPMSILDHINKGDLTPEHMGHFSSMYPEVHKFLSNEMTKQITEAQIKKEKPPYEKRQAMGMFIGADLDSSFSPLAIQTIQGLYANKQAAQQQQAPTKSKKGTSTLSKGPSAYLTDSQAREQRQQNQKA